MSNESMLISAILAGIFIVAFLFTDSYDGFWSRAGSASVIPIILSLAGFGVVSCTNSESHVKARAETAAQEARDRVPRVYSEAGGCTVYQFKAGDRWGYFTKCGTQTTTEVPYTVRSGKTSHTETQSITTVAP